jgi:voltage-gated potassium channel
LDTALRMTDRGYRVMLGDFDDPETYRAARLDSAAMLATTRADTTNSNIVFTAREVAADVPIVATATSEASVDIIELAGASEVLRLGDLLGKAISQRLLGPDCSSHVIGEFAGLQIAEASVTRTELIGQTLKQAGLRARVGVSVLGLWDRGRFILAGPDTVIEPSHVLILAATREQLDAYNKAFSLPSAEQASVVIIGGGRVGRSVGRSLRDAGVDYRIIELLSERVRDPEHYVVGDAAELSILRAAGIDDASSVVLTTHDDDVNVYLTLYCRKLRPDIEIVARANHDRNVPTLYRAGADSVLSYASTGATAIWNRFRPNDILLVAEGLDLFRAPVPRALAETPLAETGIRRSTGCNVVAIEYDGTMTGNPEASMPLPSGGELVLIGDEKAEERFLQRYGSR